MILLIDNYDSFTYIKKNGFTAATKACTTALKNMNRKKGTLCFGWLYGRDLIILIPRRMNKKTAPAIHLPRMVWRRYVIIWTNFMRHIFVTESILVCLVVGWNLIFNAKTKHPVRTLDAHYPRFTSFSSRSFPRLKKRSFPLAQKLVKLGRLLNRFPWQDASFSVFTHSSRTHVRLGAWFWSAKADIFFSESLHILAERLSQSEIELPLRKICYYSPLAEVGVSTQTEVK